MSTDAATLQPITPPLLPGNAPARVGRATRSWGDSLLKWSATGAAVLLPVMLVVLVLVMVEAAWPAFRQQGLSLIWGRDWKPGGVALLDAQGMPRMDEDGNVMVSGPVFGALPMIWGTVASSVIALVIAVPVSLGGAIFLVRIAPGRLAMVVAFLIEFLAAIPSLAYGLWGFSVLGPSVKWVEQKLYNTGGFGALFRAEGREIGPTGVDLLTAGVLLAIMIVPIITALSRDILRSVPRAQVEGTTALGATWWQSSSEMLKFSRAALFGAVILGLARAAGETIAVTLVIGNVKEIAATPFAPAQTMASLLANEFSEAGNAQHRGALWGVALLLLVMSLGFNVVARYWFVGKDSRGAGAH